MIFVSKNWPSDIRIGCKSPSSLVEFIDIDGDLEEELKEFEGFWKGWSCGFVKLEEKKLLARKMLEKNDCSLKK